MRISIIAAMGKKREIGCEGKMLWHLPDEIKMFKRLTSSHTIIVGNTTFESIGVLPERTNIVLSSTLKREGLLIATTMDEALTRVAPTETEVYVIGGQKVYETALSIADRLYLTTVEGDFPCADTFFPEYDKSEWRIASLDAHGIDERHQYSFVTRVFDRKRTKENI